MLEEGMFEPEPLDPELEQYRRMAGDMEGVFHPLVYSYPYFGETENRILNKRLEYKRKYADEALAAGKWSRYLSIHEKPYRVSALINVHALITDDAEYWRLVAETWQFTENLYETRYYWRQLWYDQRPGRYEHVMSDADRQRLGQMDDGIVVFRGSTNRAGAKGMSWTLNFDIALRMASRMGISSHHHPMVYVARGVIEKRRVLAFFEGRNEEEIVAVPGHVRNLVLTAHPRKSIRDQSA